MKTEINATKEMLGFILSIANALGSSLEDGKIDIIDLPKFIEPLLNAGVAFSNASEIPMELCELDDEEIDELIAFAKDTLDIPQDEIEDVVDCAFDTIVQLYVLTQKIKDLLPKKK